MTYFMFLLCAALGWYGALKAIRVWVADDPPTALFQPVGAVLYVFCSVTLFFFYLASERYASGGKIGIDTIPLIFYVILLMFPFALYFAGLAVTVGSQFFSQEQSMGPVRSYDKGDAAMARRAFKEAEGLYRADLQRWPGDVEALLRLAHALEADGHPKKAADELSAARRTLLDPPSKSWDLKTILEESTVVDGSRSKKMMALVYALGDLYTGPLGTPGAAIELYESTLERLGNNGEAAPLHDRLKQLVQ